jgi:hypothetical protein
VANRTKDLRLQAKLSITATAALAGVSPNTWRLYEANPDAVTPAPRAACEAAVRRLETIAADRRAA